MRSLDDIQQFTRDYASFDRRRSGLGNVLGGAVGVAVYAASAVPAHGPLMAALAVGLTVVWLVGRELIRRRVYRCLGDAREPWPAEERRRHRIFVTILALTLTAFATFLVVAKGFSDPTIVPYLIFCAITPPLVWRYLRTQTEALVGIYLLFICAICLSGHSPALLALASLPAEAAALLALGAQEHRQFRALIARLDARGALLR